eukprot:1558280-Rhodomonas_salina.1
MRQERVQREHDHMIAREGEIARQQLRERERERAENRAGATQRNQRQAWSNLHQRRACVELIPGGTHTDARRHKASLAIWAFGSGSTLRGQPESRPRHAQRHPGELSGMARSGHTSDSLSE